jgi:hypothetical protein
VIAETKKEAIELAKSTHEDWVDTKLNVSLLCDQVTHEFVSEKIDMM